MVSLSIDEKLLLVWLDCFQEARIFISAVSYWIVKIWSLFCNIEKLTPSRLFWIAKLAFWILFVIFSKDCFNLSCFFLSLNTPRISRKKTFTLPKCCRTSLGNLLQSLCYQVSQMSHEWQLSLHSFPQSLLVYSGYSRNKTFCLLNVFRFIFGVFSEKAWGNNWIDLTKLNNPLQGSVGNECFQSSSSVHQ